MPAVISERPQLLQAVSESVAFFESFTGEILGTPFAGVADENPTGGKMSFIQKKTISNTLLLITSLMTVSFYFSNAVYAEEVTTAVGSGNLSLPSPAIHDSIGTESSGILSTKNQRRYLMVAVLFLGCGLVAWVGCSSQFLVEKSAVIISINGNSKNVNKSGLILGLWPFKTVKLKRSTSQLIYFESSKMPIAPLLSGVKFAGALWVESEAQKVRTASIENILWLTLLSVPLKNFLPQLCAETPEDFENANLESNLREKFNELCLPMGVRAKSLSFIFIKNERDIENELDIENVLASVMDFQQSNGSRRKVILKPKDCSDYRAHSII